ncbi:MAG: polymer-forming cytoskeletal protein [Ignavibacteriales bacterium]|nr:polymer-forming cytoskeletal protein [Ignavibacteriales bacterium]
MLGKKEAEYSKEIGVISQGMKVEGNIISKGNLRVDGKIIGNVTCEGSLVVGETSELKGELKVNNIILNGRFEGTIVASDKIVLGTKAVVKGDLTSKSLVMEEGTRFDGRSRMTEGVADPTRFAKLEDKEKKPEIK